MVLGGVIALWAFVAMGLGNIRGFPEIPQHGRLVVHGPYRWVRHPMYASVLVITLWVKLRYEERLLMERFPEYDNYRRHIKRLIPFVW